MLRCSARSWHETECRESASWLRQQPLVSLAPRGNDMLYLAKLPAIGFRVAVQFFRCPTCMTISSKAPEEAVVKHVVL